LRKRFTSLLREETAKGTDLTSLYLALSSYPTSKALAYKSSTFKSYILGFLATLICLVTAIASTSEYRRIRPTFATLIRLVV
jgi:hypothetical protein